jgi:hypothetical protein
MGESKSSNARNLDSGRTMNRGYSVKVTNKLAEGTDFVIGNLELDKSDWRIAFSGDGLSTPAFIAGCSDENVWSAVVVLSSTAA